MKMQPDTNDNTLEDTEERQEERKSLVGNLSRKQRRRLAKKNGLFADHSGEAWRIANRHMKGDKQQRTEEHRLGE